MSETARRLWERALVLRCQTGDDKAFAELFELYRERIRYYIARLQESSADTDDVFQQVWVDVYRKLPKLRSPAAFRVWLYRLARDKVYSGFRRRKELPLPDEFADIPKEPDEEPVFSLQEVERVHECLGLLSAEHREVLVLKFLEDMTYEEIAETLQCRLGTVRSRIHYAKRRLRQKMEERS